MIKKRISSYSNTILVLLVVLFVAEVAFVPETFDWIYFLGLLLWSLFVYSKDLPAKISGIIALLLLLFIPPFVVNNFNTVADKIATWSYLFLNVAMIQLLIDYAKQNKK